MFCCFVGLALCAPGEFVGDGYEEDVAVWEELGHGEGLEDGVPAAHGGVGVEEVLGVLGPEGFVELHEDLGVGSHGEFLDGGCFPFGEGGGKFDSVVLEDTEGKGADGVCGADAAAILVVDGDAVFAVLDLGDFGVEV